MAGAGPTDLHYCASSPQVQKQPIRVSNRLSGTGSAFANVCAIGLCYCCVSHITDLLYIDLVPRNTNF